MRSALASVTAGVLVLSLAGCGGPEPTHVRGAARAACESLVKALPRRLADQGPIERDASLPGASWGDPAIVLRCGVGEPDDYDPVAKCQTADGIGWFIPKKGMFDQSADVVMTAISRSPSVEVTLPARYRPPAAAMVDLTAALRTYTKPTGKCA